MVCGALRWNGTLTLPSLSTKPIDLVHQKELYRNIEGLKRGRQVVGLAEDYWLDDRWTKLIWGGRSHSLAFLEMGQELCFLRSFLAEKVSPNQQGRVPPT